MIRWRADAPAPARPRSSLSGALAAVAPDVTEDQAHRQRKELVRQRLLGEGLPTRIGRFTLLGQVAAGEASAVYVAHDHELDRRVAVKLLHGDPDGGDRGLQRDAQALARLSHPNVVAVYEIGRWQDQLFIAMELAEGLSFDEWARAGRSWQEIVGVLLQAGRGLAAAHERGLVHGDFKLADVWIGEDGRARVLGFVLHRPGGPGNRLEASGSGVRPTSRVSPDASADQAPEQRVGHPPDALSDQLGFCAALRAALRGAQPSGARPLPARLTRAIERGLAVDRHARWPSMRHLLCELGRARRPQARWRAPAALAALAGLVVASALVGRYLLAPAATSRGHAADQGAAERRGS